MMGQSVSDESTTLEAISSRRRQDWGLVGPYDEEQAFRSYGDDDEDDDEDDYEDDEDDDEDDDLDDDEEEDEDYDDYEENDEDEEGEGDSY